MAKIIVSEVTAPAYWASALVNGDYSGMKEAEATRCAAFVGALAKDKTAIVDVVRDADGQAVEQRFTRAYDLYDPGATCRGGDVLDYVTYKRSR